MVRHSAFNTIRPALLPLRPGLFALMSEIHYYRRNGLDFVRVPLLVREGQALGLTTDGGSKPWATQWLVGGALDEGLVAYCGHDGLYRLRYVLTRGHPRAITREEADDILEEMLEDLDMDRVKIELIMTGVRIGGGRVWNRRGPCDLAAVTLENPGPDFAILTAHAVPSFNPEVAELTRLRLA